MARHGSKGQSAAESRRFAHGIIADLIAAHLDSAQSWWHGPDGDAIARALGAIQEQHRRFGPKTADRLPFGLARTGTPLLDATVGDA